MEGIAITNQEIMFFHFNLDIEVSGSTASGSHFPSPRKVHAIALIDSGRDLDLDLTSRANSTITGTL
jgi:hypothetical protein